MILTREQKIRNILKKISNKTNTLQQEIKKQKEEAELFRIIMQHVGRNNLLVNEERDHNRLMRKIKNNTNTLKEYTNVLKTFYKNSKKYTEQEINGLHRGTLQNIVNYVQTFSP
jgi:K+/H+ antiporter YhaU regulatory subunit KhtT